MRRPGTAALIAAMLVVGCEDPLESFRPTGDAQVQPAPEPGVGLAAIRERGVLRLLTRNNGTSYFVWHGRQVGFDYELGELFAEALGVRLDVVVPPHWGDLLPMIERGEGDIAAAGITVTAERQKIVRFAKPYTLTHMRVVWGKGTRRISGPEDLSGRRVHARKNSAYYRRLETLSSLFAASGREPIDIVIEGESLETEQILEEVAAGRLPYTLCDYHICLQSMAYMPRLVLGPRVGDPEPLGWAVHRDAGDLATAIDEFFASQRAGGAFEEIYRRYYERPKASGKTREARPAGGKISPFDALFAAAGQETGVDWRLLAAIAYQESRFDPKARSWGGGRGLFGLLPAVGRELGVKNPKNAAQNTLGAAQYLARMEARFAGVMDADERLQMAVAAFNCGAGHVTDARLVATREQLDANKWDSVAKALRLLSRGDRAVQAEHGYVRGGEVVRYVEQVWNRYRAYRHATGERD